MPRTMRPARQAMPDAVRTGASLRRRSGRAHALQVRERQAPVRRLRPDLRPIQGLQGAPASGSCQRGRPAGRNWPAVVVAREAEAPMTHGWGSLGEPVEEPEGYRCNMRVMPFPPGLGVSAQRQSPAPASDGAGRCTSRSSPMTTMARSSTSASSASPMRTTWAPPAKPSRWPKPSPTASPHARWPSSPTSDNPHNQ